MVLLVCWDASVFQGVEVDPASGVVAAVDGSPCALKVHLNELFSIILFASAHGMIPKHTSFVRAPG